jgi:hypothetical protein
MRRREFLRDLALTVAACGLMPNSADAEDSRDLLYATLTIDDVTKQTQLPANYMGLSYESAQLANPEFFAASNKSLIALFRELGAQGVLRLGGGTSEFTAFTADAGTMVAPFDTVGPDTSKNVKSDTPITVKSLRNLRGFLDATGWQCLYGLNLGRGTVSRAAEEASYVFDILGSQLIAFQLGNEPDAWRNRYRPASWTYEDYRQEWVAAREAVVARVPHAKFAGPDVSNKVAYVTGFATDAKKFEPEVVMLTSHYYAMGPAGAKDVTIEKLLAPDPKLERDLKVIMEASRLAGLPYRMDEGNSCWNGGQDGISNTLASALWVADVMLEFAQAGCAGMNLHGGGNGFYTPIAGDIAGGFKRRPEFFGMLLAKEFAGSSLLASTFMCSDPGVKAYVANKNGQRMILVVNKTEHTIAIKGPIAHAKSRLTLTGPTMDAKDGVAVTHDTIGVRRNGELTVLAHSAVLVRDGVRL